MKEKFKDLLTSVDVLNTLNGGVSEPYISHREQPEGRELRIRIPGVRKEQMNVEIQNNALAVFYLIPVESSGKMVFMPQIVFNQPIPFFVDVAKISAEFEANELVVKLPFNNLSSSYYKKLEIKEK